VNRRRRILLIVCVVVLVAIVAVLSFVVTRRPQRRRAVRPQKPSPVAAAAREAGKPLLAIPPDQWTARLDDLQEHEAWEQLDDELTALETQKKSEYTGRHLDYLHARTKIETNDLDDARARLEKFLTPGNQFRDLALYHLAETAAAANDEARASQLRLQFIREFPSSAYTDEVVEDHLAWLDEHGSVGDLNAFRNQLYNKAPSSLRRELDARLLARQLRSAPNADVIARAVQLLRGNAGDDPSDRLLLALDRPELRPRLSAEALLLMGESAKEHRHFDRAVALLRAAKAQAPANRQDDIAFSIGRSQFGAEQYSEAEATYIAASRQSLDARMKATFLFHASRAAQLRGDDRAAERFMTAAIAVPGKFPATSAALTQRMRTRLHQKRWSEAAADLQQIRTLFPKDHAVEEAMLSHALSLLAAGRAGEADRELAAIPRNLLEKFEVSEVGYWRGRSAESFNAEAAITHYLAVLRSAQPTHFAYFARQRLSTPAFAPKLEGIIARKKQEVATLLARKEFDKAREVQTDLVLIKPDQRGLEELKSIYLQIPRYAAIVNLTPARFPTIDKTPPTSRGETLMTLGLFDEATEEIVRRYPLRPASSALAQSLALNKAAASKESILAIEILMKSVPDDFVPELLPRTVLELLYPRYFYDAIESDAKRFNADPRLVVSIMREESRFNPRAKSVAAARGLLQFIITTARDVARAVGIAQLSPDDLYDPRTIIQLGAKYIGDLLGMFDRNPYPAAAAYNAGPNQTRLWIRMRPAPGDDYFLSSINFDETKHYVRKVLNSYWRYGEIYEKSNPAAGMRAEP
jgi:soluble lytic murein transglycosylase-like protein/TolA-binding protein